jgi:cell division protein FtsW
MEIELDNVPVEKSGNIIDKGVMTAFILLTFISMLVLYSSMGSLALKKNADVFSMGFKQVVFAIASIGVALLVSNINYTRFAKFAKMAIIIAIGLLLALKFFGVEKNGSTRWLDLPFLPSFQPTELANICVILYIAYKLTTKQDVIKSFSLGFLDLIGTLGIICFFVLMIKFATAGILFAICVVFLLVGRVKLKHISWLGISFAVMFSVMLLFKDSISVGKTVLDRINKFVTQSGMQPEYLTKNSALEDIHFNKIAIVTGGITGKGPGGSIFKNKMGYSNDYVFAIVIEEYGLAGAAVIIFLYGLLFWRSWLIAMKCTKTFPALLAIGIGLLITMQVMFHIGIVLNLFPPTGINMPLLCGGGTSMIINGVAIGMLLSISRFANSDKNVEIA